MQKALAIMAIGLLCSQPVAAQKKKPAPETVIIPPITPPAVVPTEAYGNWKVSPFGVKGFIASTGNDSGSAFGIVCDQSCSVFFNPQIACDDKAKYPALINAAAGAFAVELECVRTNDRNFMMMGFDKLVYDAMETGGDLGIAFPMASGKFQVARFSLTGALKAATRAYGLSDASKSDTSSNGLKDQTL